MTGLFLPFYANNKRSKGVNKIEVDLDWMFNYYSFDCHYFNNEIKSVHSLFSR